MKDISGEWLRSAKSDIETIDAIHAQELGRKGLSDSDQLLFTISVRNEKPFGVFVDNPVSCTSNRPNGYPAEDFWEIMKINQWTSL